MTTRTDETPLLPHAGQLPEGMVTLRGVVKGVVYRTDDKRYSVLRMTQLHGEETVIVGPLGDAAPGESLRVTGRWERHASHGPQLKVETWIPELPTSADGIARLLGSGFVKDIGPKLAQRIVERFGASTLDVIADHPERLSEVDGIGGRRAERIQEVFRVRRAEVETRSFLAGLNVGPGLARRIWERFGAESSAIVRENPYRLAEEVKGIGFLTADAIARAQGVLADDPRRIAGAVLFLLLEAVDDGHTALPPDELAVLADRFSIPPESVRAALGELGVRRTIVRDQQLIYPPPLFDAEVCLAHDLAALIRRPLKPVRREALAVPEVREALDRLNPKQRAAVEATMSAPVVVMTGGPGTGKTTTVLAIVRLHQAAGHKVLLAAPTGRAARRLSEATHHPASTIHRLLDWSPRIQRFSRDRSSPLDADLVLVDEASMVDVQLASHLVQAVRAGARLVLVGDADQLPPVGPGTVLADLLKLPEVTSVRLTEVFRQAAESAIVRGAYDVLRGEVPRSSLPRAPTGEGEVPRAPTGELYLVKCDDGEQAARLLVETVARRIPKSFGLDPMRAVQVLVPTHRGPLGAQKLNEALQAALNPLGARGRRGFAVGDKVMQLRNDYDLDVSNGDVGVIEQLDEKSVVVRMEGREVRYADDAVDNLTLAYAATVHKCVAGYGYASVEGGGLVPVRAVRAGQLVQTGGGSARRVIGHVPTGERAIVRLRTRCGYTIDVSEEHPILVAGTEQEPAFQTAGQLRAGQFACIDRTPVAGREVALAPLADQVTREPEKRLCPPTALTRELAWALGVMVGAGCYRDRTDGMICVTSQDRELIDQYRTTLEGFGLTVSERARRDHSRIDFCSKPLRRWLADLGLGFSLGPDRSTPAVVFGAPSEVRAAYLRGLFDADGSVGPASVRYTTAALRLAGEVQALLLSLGIVSRVSSQGARHHKVTISGAGAHPFEDRVGFVIRRKALALSALAARSLRGKPDLDVVPFGKALIDGYRESLAPSRGRRGQGLGANRSGRHKLLDDLKRREHRLTYAHLRRLAARAVETGTELPEKIRAALQDNYFFDEIVSVERVAETAQMYDLEVDDRHAFVVNGFVCHNSQGSEYDAVVLGLHTSHFVLLNRALLYTAITRARRLVVIVGSRRALEMAVSTRRVVERHGALLARLRAEFTQGR